MASRKIEIVLDRDDYNDSMDLASLVVRFYNEKDARPIRQASSVVPKDHTDQEVATHLLREMLV